MTQKERYEYLKATHICVSCGINHTTTVRCEACRTKRNTKYKSGTCNFDCFNCEFPDCIANSITILKHQAEIGEVILYAGQ